ncbi:hypothetical protein [Salinirubrum litoreum]|uniref:Glycosyltransferase RgtA/B/C/D-like domain-containing protein n=1 Tax=Salinirubrum litoreum TaxID=1126234 RepID=A0ABD5RF17_9EURY|nr:hypothetical protein [Salinirubrum litoreum]
MSLWVDESISARAAVSLLERGEPSIRRLGEGYKFYQRGILHTIFVSLSILIAGKSELAVRLPGIVWGTLLIPVSYWWGTEFADRERGLIFAVLIAFVPWQIATARYTRFYAQFQTLFMIGLLLFFLWYRSCDYEFPTSIPSLRESSLLTLSAYVLTVLLSRLTHRYWVSIVAIPVVLVFVSQAIKQRELDHRDVSPREIGYGVILVTVSVTVAYLVIPSDILALFSINQWQSADFLAVPAKLLGINALLVVLAAIGVTYKLVRLYLSSENEIGSLLKETYGVISLVSIFSLLSIGLPLIRETVDIRYLSPLAPLLIYEVASLLHSLLVRVAEFDLNRTPRYVVTVVLILALLFTPSTVLFMSENQYGNAPPHTDRVVSHDMGGASEFVEPRLDQGDTVYTSPLNTVAFYLGHDRNGEATIRYLSSPQATGGNSWADASYAIGSAEEMETQVKKDAENGTVWFVIYDLYWRGEENEQWVESNAQLVSAEWKNVVVYKYEAGEQSTLEHVDRRARTLNRINDYPDA